MEEIYYMQNIALYTGYIFFIVFAMLSIWTKQTENKYHVFVKPVSLVILAILFTVSTIIQNKFDVYIASAIVALLFGALGDYFMSRHEKFFFPGLYSFLLGHLLLITAFSKNYTVIWYLTPVYILSFITLMLIFSKMKPETRRLTRVPMIIYVAVLSSMFIFSAGYGYNNGIFLQMLLGGMLFIVSDTLLTFHIFIKKFKYDSTAILTTYYLAELMLCDGLLKTMVLN
ncbi:MAG TPA: hypothetical protein DDY71_10785 [Spirochaetia bacterium]|nr:hypothetical protein [Spirochaetia bacterium]HBI38119.1 hypothetical protein [Spirochaetia bacterium]